jgi:hypothetical protein
LTAGSQVQRRRVKARHARRATRPGLRETGAAQNELTTMEQGVTFVAEHEDEDEDEIAAMDMT